MWYSGIYSRRRNIRKNPPNPLLRQYKFVWKFPQILLIFSCYQYYLYWIINQNSHTLNTHYTCPVELYLSNYCSRVTYFATGANRRRGDSSANYFTRVLDNTRLFQLSAYSVGMNATNKVELSWDVFAVGVFLFEIRNQCKWNPTLVWQS